MLIYHFGSKEGLLAQVVAAVEQGQREFLAGLAASEEPASVAVRRFWRGLTDPAVREHERLFFEVVAMALQGRPGPSGCARRSSSPGSRWSPRTASGAVWHPTSPGRGRGSGWP